MCTCKSLLIAATILCSLSHFCATAFAEETSEDKEPLSAGSWSVQFQIAENLLLSSFQGSTLSAKRHLSAQRAIRFGLSLSADFRDSDRTLEQFDSDLPSGGSNALENSNNQNILLLSQYMFYPSPSKNINMYFGVGPGFSLGRSSRDQDTANVDDATTIGTTLRGTNFSLGVDWAFGVEWFVARNISLLGEYGGALRYRWSKTKQTNVIGDRDQRRDTVNKSLELGANPVRLGVSVYF